MWLTSTAHLNQLAQDGSLIQKAQSIAKQELDIARAKKRRADIELLLHNALRDSVIVKREYETKMRAVEECWPQIKASVEHPDQLRHEEIIEQRLGLSGLRELVPIPTTLLQVPHALAPLALNTSHLRVPSVPLKLLLDQEHEETRQHQAVAEALIKRLQDEKLQREKKRKTLEQETREKQLKEGEVREREREEERRKKEEEKKRQQQENAKKRAEEKQRKAQEEVVTKR